MNETIRSIKHVGDRQDTLDFTEEPASQNEVSESRGDDVPLTKMHDLVEDNHGNTNVFAKAVKEMITINIIRSENYNGEESMKKLEQLEKVSDHDLGLKYAKRQTLQTGQSGKALKKVEELRSKDNSFDEDVQLLIRMLES